MGREHVHCVILAPTRQNLDLLHASSAQQESSLRSLAQFQMCAIATRGRPDRMEQERVIRVPLEPTRQPLGLSCAPCAQ